MATRLLFRSACASRCDLVKGNNAYIFPGVGLAALACGATRITDLDMYIAAKALAKAVPKVRTWPNERAGSVNARK